LIYDSQDIRVTNEPFLDILFTTFDETEYLIIDDDAIAELYTEDGLNFLKDPQITIVKYKYL
jgi:hypothetical protein